VLLKLWHHVDVVGYKQAFALGGQRTKKLGIFSSSGWFSNMKVSSLIRYWPKKRSEETGWFLTKSETSKSQMFIAMVHKDLSLKRLVRHEKIVRTENADETQDTC
jgi:hypothetical protein